MARRIKLKKPIYNRTSFLDKKEVEYYRMYKKNETTKRNDIRYSHSSRNL